MELETLRRERQAIEKATAEFKSLYLSYLFVLKLHGRKRKREKEEYQASWSSDSSSSSSDLEIAHMKKQDTGFKPEADSYSCATMDGCWSEFIKKREEEEEKEKTTRKTSENIENGMKKEQ